LAAVPSIGRATRIESSVAPEADATRSLYEQYAPQIFRYCLHQLGSREEAEDAVQSTFLNAFRGIKRGVVPELESAWLFKIAHNVCLSRRRSAWRRGRIESPADFEVVEELTPAPSRRSDELIGLQDVLEAMPEMQRRAILLREWQGLSYREIAEELALSQAAVETLIFRARRSLASGLEQPSESRNRAVRAFDWGNVVSALKSLVLGGSVAAKVAATVAVVSATTVVAASPAVHRRAAPHPHVAAPAAAPKHVRRVVHRLPAATVPVQSATPVAVAERMRAVHHHAVAPARRAVPAPSAPVVAAPVTTPAPTPSTPVPTPAPAAVSEPAAPAPSTPAPADPAPAEPDPQPSADPHPKHFQAVPVQPTPQPTDPSPGSGGHDGDHGNGSGNWNGNGNGRQTTIAPTPVQAPAQAPVVTLPVEPTGNPASIPSAPATQSGSATSTVSTLSQVSPVSGAQPGRGRGNDNG